ncbi:hypothetical protein TVAG_177210 [Trichomonas vaginalis G3]|uniref:Uncharacterized protein n=1 Tax=Trichomonas vaginalis (strain ATCC PRA-98 / G3) TaxID=412133 RepID=A2G3D0_TRIV3|nr:hypothetical protein TVAGG3_0053490 [Trichomonas vaginalis G3]EAX88335.1 hypothetical protein TVAG_177210 [Trichomonas vaginalis G3]KAI5541466.1 hypothetical protein TVAGG3_0053490 [Trichomonas vaginalis G3]|eukprot:XP_001301265.1 hypothetical protein [Trichomonas vaginalis G3]
MEETIDPSQFDLRRWNVGGWESSKLKTKANGKWIYIYDGDSKQLINLPEPIHFEKRYIPPNYSKHDHLPVQSLFDTRTFERSIENPSTRKAPLSFSQPVPPGKLVAPVVYSQFCQSKRLNGVRTAKCSPRKKLLQRASTSVEKRSFSQSQKDSIDSTLSPFITHFAPAEIITTQSATLPPRNI